MWKAIVEKLLTRYLSEYVDGIEREKLQVGLLSGDIELNDLILKPEATEAYDVPFSIVYGRIGRLAISISWTRWMAQNYDLRVTVEHVHIILRPRVPIEEKTTAQLKQDLRNAKERQVLRRETQLVEALRLKNGALPSSKDTSFVMKIGNRILKNIELELRDVHVVFHDVTRGFSIGCLLDRGSLFSSTASGERTDTQIDNDIICKSALLQGLSIYGGTSKLKDWDTLLTTTNDKAATKTKATQFLFKIQASLPPMGQESRYFPSTTPFVMPPVLRQPFGSATSSLSSGSPECSSMNLQQPRSSTPPPESLEFKPQPCPNSFSRSSVNSNTPTQKKKPSSAHESDGYLEFDYILLPLHVLFRFISNPSIKEVTATLEIGKESQGIAFSRTQMRTVLDLWHEAEAHQRYCNALLASGVRHIRVDPDGLQTMTRPIFTQLYTKKLHYELGLAGNRGPLSPADTERLAQIHDAVPVRYLAKWRAACVYEAEKRIAANRSLIQAEVAEARKQQSWWHWATQGTQAVEEAVVETMKNRDANSILTDDEAAFMSNAILAEIGSDATTPTMFNLSFNLPRFSLVLYDNLSCRGSRASSVLSSGSAASIDDPFLCLTLCHVGAALQLHSCIDRNDKEAYEWTWTFVMADFSVKHRHDSILTFRRRQDSKLTTDVKRLTAELESVRAVRRQKRTHWEEAPTARPDLTREDLQAVATRVESSALSGDGLTQDDIQLRHLATVWEFRHEVTDVGNVTSVFIRMSALEIAFNSDLLRDFLNFFLIESHRQATIATSESFGKELESNLINQGGEEFYDEMLENVHRLHAAAKEKVPDLLDIDMVLCAPILSCTTVDGSSVVAHFGQLKLSTAGPCRYSELALSVEMNQTQLTCIGSQGNAVPILRPVPVAISIQYLPASFSLALDVVFCELYLDVNPEAIAILLAVQSTMTWSVVKGRLEASYQEAYANHESGTSAAPTIDTLLASPSAPGLLTNDADTSSVDGRSVNMEVASGMSEADSDLLGQHPLFRVKAQLLVSRMGFSLLNSQKQEVLRVGAINLYMLGRFDPRDCSTDETGFTYQVNLQIQGIFATDPSTRTPLFVTRVEGTDAAAFEKELFGRIHGTRSLHEQSFKPVLADAAPPERNDSVLDLKETGDDPLGRRSASYSRKEGSFAEASSGPSEEVFADAVDDELPQTLEVSYVSDPSALLTVAIASCELHWQKESIRQVLMTYEDLRSFIATALEQQLHRLKENVRQFIRDADCTVEHPAVVAALEVALSYVKGITATQDPVVGGTLFTAFSRRSSGGVVAQAALPPSADPVTSHGLQPEDPFPKFGDQAGSQVPQLTCRVSMASASVHFWQNREIFARGELVHVKTDYILYASSDATSSMTVGGAHVNLSGRQILSSWGLDTDRLTTEPPEVISKATHEPVPMFSAEMRLYSAEQRGAPRPCSACLKAKLNRVSYVFFQKDLSALLNYISDGILDAVLWRSYEAAYNLASSSYFFFVFDIHRTLFILAEDKEVIPQLEGVLPTSSSSRVPQKDQHPQAEISRRPDTTAGESVGLRIQTDCLGSYVTLHLNRLVVRNAYTPRPTVTPESDASQPDTTVTASVFLQVEGLSASMTYSSLYGFFSPDVTGDVLQPVEVVTKIRAGDPLLVDLHMSGLKLNFSREQLTLLLDILNENFGGLGYHPTAVELQGESEGSEDANKDETVVSDVDVDRDVHELLSTPPLRISVRITVDSIRLDAAFGVTEPLAHLNATNIYIACDVSLYPIYITYQFALLGEAVVLDDHRRASRNTYKRFLECFPWQRSRSSVQTNGGTSAHAPKLHLNYGFPEPYQDGGDPPGTLLQWMRPGIELKYLDTCLSGPDDDERLWSSLPSVTDDKHTAPQGGGFDHCIAIFLESSVTNNRFCVELTDPTVYVFTVGMQDVLDWVLSGFGFSTMRRYPRPTPEVVTAHVAGGSASRDTRIQQRVQAMFPADKPFIADVKIERGIFNVFSNLTGQREPVMQWQNDLTFQAEFRSAITLFKLIEISDCRMRRVDIFPNATTPTSPMFDSGLRRRLSSVSSDVRRSTSSYEKRQQRQGSLKPFNSFGRLDGPKPLFVPVSHVILCDGFSLVSSGSMQTLYDPATENHKEDPQASQQPTTQDLPNAPSPTSAFLRIPTSSSTRSRLETREDLRTQHTPRRCEGLEREFRTLDPDVHSRDRPGVALSEFTLSTEIPEFALRVSSRDIAVLLSAFRSLQSDTPSVSPGLANPPVVPANNTSMRESRSASGSHSASETSSEEHFESGKEKPPSETIAAAAAFLAPSSSVDVVCESSQQQRQSDTTTWNRSLQHPSSDTEAPAVDRYCHFTFKCRGFDMTVLDDLRGTLSPILKTQVAMEQLGVHVTPRVLAVQMSGLHLCMDYMSPRSGFWEPCVERFSVAFTLAFRSVASPLKSRKEISRDISSPQRGEGGLEHSSVDTNKQLSAQRQQLALPKPTTTPSVHQHRSSSLLREWKTFDGHLCVDVVSATPLWVNVTPQLCQLLLWFVPTLFGYVTATTLAHDGTTEPQMSTSPCPVPKALEPLKDDTAQDMSLSRLGVSSFPQTTHQQHHGDDAPETSSAYHYVNLTDNTYIAFSLASPEAQWNVFGSSEKPTGTQTPTSPSQQSMKLHVSSILRLVPTVTPKSLRGLSEHQVSAWRQQGKQKTLHAFLATEPPPSTFARVEKTLPYVPRDMLLRNLLVTRDAAKTVRVFESLKAAKQGDNKHTSLSESQRPVEGLADPSPPFLGPFPRAMEVSVLALSRTNATLLSRPMCPLGQQTAQASTRKRQDIPPPVGPPTPRTDRMSRPSTSPRDDQECDEEVDGAHFRYSAGVRRPLSAHCCSEPSLASAQGDQVSTTPPGIVVTPTVATVLAPHPSYKLCLITTCIRLRNCSGMPLQIAFLDASQQPLLLDGLRYCCAPCTLLDSHDPASTASRQHEEPFPKLEESSSKRAYVEPQLQPIRESQSSFPLLHSSPVQCLALQQQRNFGFSVIVPNGHFLSVPQTAFIEPMRVQMVFRPAVVAEHRLKLGTRHEEAPLRISTATGWSTVIDTGETDDPTKRPAYTRSCLNPDTLLASLRSGGVSNSPSQVPGVLQRKKSTRHHHTKMQPEDKLYFTVVRTDTPTPLPAEQPIINLSIYPSLTIVNSCPIPMCVELVAQAFTQPINPQTVASPRPLASPSFFSNFQGAPDMCSMDSQELNIVPYVNERTPTHFLFPKNSLSMRLRCGYNESPTGWSSPLRFTYPPEKDDPVGRIQLGFLNYSKFEVEVYKDPQVFSASLQCIETGQAACVLSCPRWFINRTGTKIVASKPNSSGRPFPYFEPLTLLGDSEETTIQLNLVDVPVDKERQGTNRGIAEIPSVGGASEFSVDTGRRYFTFVLQTSRIATQDTGGVAARCISLVPKYLITNGLKTTDLYLRQHKAPGPMTVIKPGKTKQLHWAVYREKLLFEFRPGESEGYQWSGPVHPCEAFVGGNTMAIYNGKRGRPEIFNIQITPQTGVCCVIIRSLEECPDSNAMRVILDNTLTDVDVHLKALHGKRRLSRPSVVGGATGLRSTDGDASDDLDIVFYAAPESYTTVAWPWPFTCESFSAFLSFYKDGKKLGPGGAITFDPHRRQNAHYATTGSSINVNRIALSLMTRGNDVVISVHLLKPLKSHAPARPLPYHQASPTTAAIVAAPKQNFQLSVRLAQVGVSMVSDRRREELLFAEVTQVSLVFLRREEDQLIELRLSDIQIDSQLEESSKPVLLANRGSSTSFAKVPPLDFWADAIPTLSHLRCSTTPCQQSSSASLPVRLDEPHPPGPPRLKTLSEGYGLEAQEPKTPPYFLYTWIERESISSSDLHLKRVFIILDDIEIDIDAEMLNGITEFADECLDVFGLARPFGVPRQMISSWASTSIEANFDPPPPGQVVVLDEMQIQGFRAILWCSFHLDKVAFLSDIIKVGLRILMVSQKLELKGAPLTFDTEVVDATMRGSLSTLVQVMKGRYLTQIVKSIGVVLGYSSLATIPRAPLDLVRGTLGLGLTVADNLSSGLGAILSTLTFDSDYISQRQKERSSAAKTPTTLKEGLSSASKDLKDGFKHLGDIVTKPIGGAQKEGFTGLVKGLGKGVVGTFVKPVDKLGQVVSTMASGLRAEYVTKPLGGYKCRNERRRKPRMLWGEMGLIREYNHREAELRECLGLQMAKNVLQSVTVSVRECDPAQHLAILVYPKRLCFVDLYAGRGRTEWESTPRSSANVPVSANVRLHDIMGRARLLWSVELAEISGVRASSHGVSIQTQTRGLRQIPCLKAMTIKRVYDEICRAQHRVKGSLQVCKIADWLEHQDD